MGARVRQPVCSSPAFLVSYVWYDLSSEMVMYSPRRSILNTAITWHMCRYDRNDISSFSQEQSARRTRNSSAGGIQSVICSWLSLDDHRDPSRELTQAQRRAVSPGKP
jgi:hypothetical protein